MVGIAFGLGASLCWGASDFIGGLQSRRAPQIGVMLASAIVGFLGLTAVVVATGAAQPETHHLLAGVAAGLAITAALFAFYRGLAIGAMSVVAPIAATGAVVPLVVGVARGDRPGAVALAGCALAILGVVLVSRQHDDGTRTAAAMSLSVVLAIVAALLFGSSMVGLHEAAKGDPLWAALAASATTLVLMVVIALVALARGAAVAPGRAAVPWLLALGLFNAGANALYASATRHGDLGTVAIASSLYPVVTVLLARAMLGERVRHVQGLGIVAALGGIVLIAAGN